jgi:16S rRNA (uracil1498-N3)-methyltransferase
VRHLYGPLRIRPGDKAYISDNDSFRYTAELVKINKIEAEFRVLKKIPIYRELPRITLFQCILKKNAMEYAIQKTTEIGVSSIIPVISKRTVAGAGDEDRKIKRWQKISDEASKQSKRDFKCSIGKSIMLEDIDVRAFEHFFIPYEDSPDRPDLTDSLCSIKDMKNIAYIIGPEGGFSPQEAELFKKNNAVLLRFGKNILRAETAAVYFLSVIDFYIRTNS